jgi:hypothetical protein
MFSEKETNLILQDFPKFELSYEIITHKKVLGTTILLAIPEGKKCFAWFTSYKNDNVCFILEINENKNIVDIQIAITSFSNKIVLGTIFYGTFFNNKNTTYFCIEDLYYYSGKSCYNYSYLSKLERLKDIFKNEMSQPQTDLCTIFGIPLILDDLQLMLKEIKLLPYNVSDIKFRFFDNENSKKILVMKYFKSGSHKKDINLKKEAIFKITADIEPDIYNLFIYNNGIEEYYDIAFVPDYKTSVMMNHFFRKIKENDNLDAIEESDDDEDFQDSREDKYVYLDRSFNMTCEYNNKFKRWVPIRLAGKNDRIFSITSTKQLLKNIKSYDNI